MRLGWDQVAFNSELVPLKKSVCLAVGAVTAWLMAHLANFKSPKDCSLVDDRWCGTSSKRGALAVQRAVQTDFM